MTPPRLRCAIYTRKSSDEGLDQAFNSLDAQYEACTAYIASQRHEGWRAVSKRYDDGGISGGTLERHGLQELLADIDTGHIDRVVVYKIDRLTRSLADFAKLVERLEAKNCSFVSVTQSFDTSTSMGRLTLHVLLSFAQFEREVTAERIRDKIAASKKKGLWMGGVAPLGYDPHPDTNRRELVVNDVEALVVRQLFALYAEHGCLNAVAREAVRLGLRSKQHHFSTGTTRGGQVFSRGQLHKILTNPVYRGLIRHKDKTFPGTHAAIIDAALWDEVQTRLQQASARRRGTPNGQPGGTAPLLGKFQDETGDRLTPSHTRRRGKRIDYYISNRLISGGRDPAGWRLPAAGFEAAVAATIQGHLRSRAQHHDLLADADALSAAAASDRLTAALKAIKADGIASSAPLIEGGTVARGRLAITLRRDAVAALVACHVDAIAEAALRLEAPFDTRRRGIEVKIVAGECERAPDPAMLKALRNARRWSAALQAGTSLGELAQRAKVSERYMAKILPLAGLSSRIQTAIVEGNQPLDLTLARLLRDPLPLDWQAQERGLGIQA